MLPQNKENNNVGSNISPVVSDFIGLYDDNKNYVTWKFVDFDNVPEDLEKTIATPQINSIE